MKVAILIDNNTLIHYPLLGEPGFSALIEESGKKILFDVGYTDAFLQNARRMNLSLLDVDDLALSHGHLDHTWGLDALIRMYTEAAMLSLPFRRPRLIAHPAVWESRAHRGIPEIGSILTKDKLSRHFDVQLLREPVWLTENLLFLGEIPRTNSFEAQASLGAAVDGDSQKPDFILDDTALVYKNSDGLVVMTGCSHSGICNIVEYARTLCKTERVLDIIGGFHLQNPSTEQLEGVLNYMKNLSPNEIHACHCTDLPSKIALAQSANLKEIGVGSHLEYR